MERDSVDTSTIPNIAIGTKILTIVKSDYFTSATKLTRINELLKSDSAASNKSYLNAIDEFGHSPLIYAAESGDAKLVTTLLENGYDINAQSPNGETPLNVAIKSQRNNKDVIEVLVNNGAKVKLAFATTDRFSPSYAENINSFISCVATTHLNASESLEATLRATASSSQIIKSLSPENLAIVGVLTSFKSIARDRMGSEKSSLSPKHQETKLERLENLRESLEQNFCDNGEDESYSRRLANQAMVHYFANHQNQKVDDYINSPNSTDKNFIFNPQFNENQNSIYFDSILDFELSHQLAKAFRKTDSAKVDHLISKGATLDERLINLYPKPWDEDYKNCVNSAITTYANCNYGSFLELVEGNLFKQKMFQHNSLSNENLLILTTTPDPELTHLAANELQTRLTAAIKEDFDNQEIVQNLVNTGIDVSSILFIADQIAGKEKPKNNFNAAISAIAELQNNEGRDYKILIGRYAFSKLLSPKSDILSVENLTTAAAASGDNPNLQSQIQNKLEAVLKEGLNNLAVSDESESEKLPKLIKLLTQNADINSRDKSGLTFLEQASQKGHGEIVELLISSGATATPTALRLALQNNHQDIAANLRNNGVEEPSLSPPQKIASTNATKINSQPRYALISKP